MKGFLKKIVHSVYRLANGGANVGTVGAILPMGGRDDIQNEAFFWYYIERYYPEERPTGMVHTAAMETEYNSLQEIGGIHT